MQISSRVENSRTLARKYVNLMIDTYVNICIWGLLSVIKSARVEENIAIIFYKDSVFVLVKFQLVSTIGQYIVHLQPNLAK